MRIHIPEQYWGASGWSLIIRFNGAHMQSGSFQLWNANFFNIYRKANGLEIHIHQKYYTANDLDDRHSFLLVSERLSLGDLRKHIIFFP